MLLNAFLCLYCYSHFTIQQVLTDTRCYVFKWNSEQTLPAFWQTSDLVMGACCYTGSQKPSKSGWVLALTHWKKNSTTTKKKQPNSMAIWRNSHAKELELSNCVVFAHLECLIFSVFFVCCFLFSAQKCGGTSLCPTYTQTVHLVRLFVCAFVSWKRCS